MALTAQEEAVLCLLLALDGTSAGQPLAQPVLWGLALLLGGAGAQRYLAYVLLKAHVSQRNQPALWLAMCQACPSLSHSFHRH